MNEPGKAADLKSDFEFNRWLEYEKITMHFNDLLIRLRIQALGGLAAICAIR
jgi:hypothetical protein